MDFTSSSYDLRRHHSSQEYGMHPHLADADEKSDWIPNRFITGSSYIISTFDTEMKPGGSSRKGDPWNQ